VLIKGEAIVGLFDDWAAARQEGLTRFLGEPFLDVLLTCKMELDGPARRVTLEF
jgi:hypothetical protein